ncbi:MAG: type II secretion system F family protein [Lachnospiraceae bacterium]|nr:type II secretion system F family protein [Lachnospiraceae bacterium]
MQQKRLSNQEIASFCGQTAMLFQAGIAPAEAISILLNDSKTNEGKEILSQILDICKKGEPFSSSLRTVDVFPEYVLHMISLGEESGNLDDVMQSLAAYYEREDSIADSIRSAVSYPFIMIGIMVLVIFVLLGKVMPIFNQVFIQLGSEMTGISATLLGIGNSLNRYSVIIVAILAVGVIVYFLATKTKPGRRITRNILSAFPITKGFYEKLAAGRFASGMALTISSGMDTFTSLDMVSELTEHKGMQEKIAACKKAIQDGSNFSEALTSSGIFSNLYSRMVAVGFRTGSIDVVMQKIADNYDKETEKKIRSIISILEPTLVIILSIIVGLILLSVIFPLMGIMSSIG